MSDSSVTCLEDCLIALGSKKPFLREPKVDDDDCVQPFTKSGGAAYDKLRAILFFLESQKVIEKFDEDLLDEIADSFGIY